MDSIKVSIITVCYNSEKTLERTIKSVMAQSYANLEYIIVDGGSKDNSLQIIKKYQTEFQEKIKYISEPDDGIYFAMNKGIHLSTGEIIGILNSDDYYECDAVEKIVNAYREDSYQVIYGMMRQWKDGLEDEVRLLSHHFLKQRMICHPSTFVTKSIYEKWGCFNTKYTSAADYDFFLRICDEKEIIFTPVYSVISNYTVGGFSCSKAGQLDKLRMLKNRRMISLIRFILCYVRVCLGI